MLPLGEKRVCQARPIGTNSQMKRLDAGGHRTVDNPYMSRSTIQVLSKRDPRVEPIAGVLQRPSDGDLKPFTGWLQLTQIPVGGQALRDRPVTPRRRL